MGKRNSKFIKHFGGAVPETNINFDSFEVLRAIGRGSFGKVNGTLFDPISGNGRENGVTAHWIIYEPRANLHISLLRFKSLANCIWDRL